MKRLQRRPVSSVAEVLEALRELAYVHARVEITRRGSGKTLSAGFNRPTSTGEAPTLGARLMDTDEGVIVSAIQPNSVARACGLAEGDVIRVINGVFATSASEVVRVLAAIGNKLWQSSSPSGVKAAR